MVFFPVFYDPSTIYAWKNAKIRTINEWLMYAKHSTWRQENHQRKKAYIVRPRLILHHMICTSETKWIWRRKKKKEKAQLQAAKLRNSTCTPCLKRIGFEWLEMKRNLSRMAWGVRFQVQLIANNIVRRSRIRFFFFFIKNGKYLKNL